MNHLLQCDFELVLRLLWPILLSASLITSLVLIAYLDPHLRRSEQEQRRSQVVYFQSLISFISFFFYLGINVRNELTTAQRCIC